MILFSIMEFWKYWFTTCCIWLQRAGMTRGFGVQSPSAYSFIRYVINEHYPYYAYSDLKDRLHLLSRLEHKLGRLLFRLANFWQADVRYMDVTKLLPYMYAGCHHSRACELDAFLGGKHSNDEKNMVIIDFSQTTPSVVKNDILPLCSNQTMLVCLNLHASKESYLCWKEIQDSSFSGITYDLYYAGIVFFDQTKFKQHYQVNF